MAEFVEFQMDAGSTFYNEITVNDGTGQPKDLTDYTVRAQMRKSYYSTSAINFEMNILDAPFGIISMQLPAQTTSEIRAGRYVYDVEIESENGIVTRIFEGIVTVLPNVTR